VVITGVGVVSCIGQGKDDFWRGILAEKTGLQRIQRFDASPYRARVGGEIRDFRPADHFDARQLKRLDRHTQMALVSARMAVADAGLAAGTAKRDPRWGISLGTALGGIAEAEQAHVAFLREGLKSVNPMLAIQIFGGSSSSNLSIELGLTGPCYTSSNSCASGTMAIGEAYRYIRDGYADRMLAGGSEAPLNPLTFGAFDQIHCMSAQEDPARACRPFDRNRDGFVMAEGAGMLMLESEESARGRGADVYGEIRGYACNSDAYHMTASLADGECAARCIRDALEDAGIRPEEIDYINAHASSTPMNDRNETTAIKRALGDHARRVAVSGTKPFHGHPLGATGAIEAVTCALALRHQHIPPTLHLEERDPDCDIDCVPLHGRSAHVRVALSNSFGFGGVNASIVLAK
jgi:3-oxoacyl-[acyl-carrier-protein] synthase II